MDDYWWFCNVEPNASVGDDEAPQTQEVFGSADPQDQTVRLRRHRMPYPHLIQKPTANPNPTPIKAVEGGTQGNHNTRQKPLLVVHLRS
jgi:hypothetical protein